MIGCGLLNRNLFMFCSQTRKITLIRNGETIWNKDKKWVGWADVPLSSFGIKEVKQCAKHLKQKGAHFDKVYTSVLGRAIKSTNYILDELDSHYVPVIKDWRLNEKHYGSLQGVNKVEMNEKHGEKVVTQWRTSMTVPPPPLDRTHESHPANNPLYKDVDPALLPSSECLGDIVKRLRPLWQNEMSKDVKKGKELLVVGHGSSLRGLIYTLMPSMSEDQIKKFNIPNAVPIILCIDGDMKVSKIEYLGDESEIEVKMDKIKFETQKKDV